MEDEQKNIAETLLSAGRGMGMLQHLDGIPYVLVPEEWKVQSLEHLLAAPRRTSMCVTHTEQESFVTHWDRFHDEDSVLFASEPEGARLTAIFDYDTLESSANRDNRAVLALATTPEWDTWKGRNKTLTDNVDFAKFIEDNTPDIIRPTGAEMLSIAKSMKVKRDSHFHSNVDSHNGSLKLNYQETVQGTATGPKGEINVPETFYLGIPIFRGGAPMEIECRLRYRIREGTLQIGYEIYRLHDVLRTAFNLVVEDVETRCGRTAFRAEPPPAA